MKLCSRPSVNTATFSLYNGGMTLGTLALIVQDGRMTNRTLQQSSTMVALRSAPSLEPARGAGQHLLPHKSQRGC